MVADQAFGNCAVELSHKGRADYREDLHAPESSAICSIRRPRSPRVLANMPFDLRSTLSHVAENE